MPRSGRPWKLPLAETPHRLARALTWIEGPALRALRATIDLPAGITLQLTYDHGELRVVAASSGRRRSRCRSPTWPTIRAEIAKLIDFGKDVAEALVTRKAEGWLKSKLSLSLP